MNTPKKASNCKGKLCTPSAEYGRSKFVVVMLSYSQISAINMMSLALGSDNRFHFGSGAVSKSVSPPFFCFSLP